MFGDDDMRAREDALDRASALADAASREMTGPRTSTSTRFDLDHIFAYHAPTDAQRFAYEAIREAAKRFAAVLLDYTPECADQSAAMRHLRECVMTANASIALEGRL